MSDKHYLTAIDTQIDEQGDAGFKPSDSGFSMLVDETTSMEGARRAMEQEGHKRYAKVNARERNHEADDTAQLSEGLAQEEGLKSHPILGESQRFDGIDNNLNPEPPLNSEARREFDNQRREQEKEKQHRLGNMPQFSNKPNPKPSPF